MLKAGAAWDVISQMMSYISDKAAQARGGGSGACACQRALGHVLTPSHSGPPCPYPNPYTPTCRWKAWRQAAALAPTARPSPSPPACRASWCAGAARRQGQGAGCTGRALAGLAAQPSHPGCLQPRPQGAQAHPSL